MEFLLPDIIDKITIVKLKIEKVGEPHLNEELAEYEKALKEFEDKGIQIKQEWFDELSRINRGIWDLEYDARVITLAEDVWEAAEKNFGFEELGRRARLITQFVLERSAIKNKIAEETGCGFKEIKKDYCGQ